MPPRSSNFSSLARALTLLALAGPAVFPAAAQPPAAPRIEPGLEIAVRWIWKVEPSPPGHWGLPLPALPVPPPVYPQTFPGGLPVPSGSTVPRAILVTPATAENSYTVKRGDALFVIGRRFKVPVALLKEVNGLATDTIRVGQVLRIPSPEEIRARAPVPSATPSAAPNRPAVVVAKKDPEKVALDIVAVQVFLDRAGFSAGPINGQDSPAFQQVAHIYRDTHGTAPDMPALQKLALAAGDPLTTYTLKREDFRFIAPPKAARAEAGGTPDATPRKKSKTPAPVNQPQAKPTYQELTSTPMLAYRTPWEFVAERFHCDEAYLHHLNRELRDVPTVGTELRVPNVVPFAIERALEAPLQPIANPQLPITAAVMDLSRLEISRAGKLIAVMPISMARPGLRGRDPWLIGSAIPRPQLVTEQELRVKPQPVTRIFGREDPDATPLPAKVHIAVEQTIAPGPNNPIGILWVNLLKTDSPEPLPYGLHGTSIPDYMRTQESLGGIRLTNWDIARAVRLLPQGTALEWKQGGPMAPVPAARPAL